MIFDSPTPEQNGFYELETPYQKMVYRQATAMDVHVYQLLSARSMLAVSTMAEFLDQDSRVVADEWRRVDSLHHNISSQLMQMNSHVPEGIDDLRDLDPVLDALVERDKRGKEA